MADELPEILVVMALEIEAQGVFEREQIRVTYTGLGKINATLGLTRKLAEYRHAGRKLPLVVNFGTAGSRTFKTGETVACRSFVQRDMDVRSLGFALGETPFERAPQTLEFPAVFPNLPEGLCGTADRFETGEPELHCDVVDMEGYAFAKVCFIEGANFGCVKYVTDGADHAAATDWESNLPRAAHEFLRLYRELST